MKRKREIFAGDDNSGITVRYFPTNKLIDISGFYDSIVGIQGTEIPLKDFLQQLGITLADCKKSLED